MMISPFIRQSFFTLRYSWTETIGRRWKSRRVDSKVILASRENRKKLYILTAEEDILSTFVKYIILFRMRKYLQNTINYSSHTNSSSANNKILNTWSTFTKIFLYEISNLRILNESLICSKWSNLIITKLLAYGVRHFWENIPERNIYKCMLKSIQNPYKSVI